MTDYSKKAFDHAIRTWEQLIGVKSVQQAIQIQSDYAKKAYENHMAELSKLAKICVGMAELPVQAGRGEFQKVEKSSLVETNQRPDCREGSRLDC